MMSARVLVVEDEGIVALDIQNRLRQIGHRPVGRAATGEEAIELADTLQPDLILMDVRLAGELDGIEAAERIRSRHDVPIIYLTAYANEQTLQRAKSTQPYGYLIKPFEERELHNTIEIALYRHEMERKVRQQAQQMRQILGSVPDGVLLLDPDYRIILKNQIATRYLNIICGSVPERLTEVGDFSMRDFAVSNTAQLWHEITVEHSRRCLTFEISIRPVLATETDYEQAETGWVVVIRDVTDAREMRRRAQQQEQLAAVGQLAAGIAHDFNNILASINMAVEMVQRSHDKLSDANRERLAMVLGQGQRAADLIKQIMDFSRRSLSEQKEVDLRKLFDEAKRILEHTLPETIAVTWGDDGAPGGFVVRADSTQLMQVIMNLAVNARDAMPRGGSLHFALSSIQVVDGDQHMLSGIPSGDYVCIRVSDTGHGIDRESLPHIFEPFFTTKAPSQGTGLGLAQVYGIVQRHGGFIDVDSVPGEGTSFTIYLPRLTNPESVSISPETEVVADVTSGTGQMVLLVEDDTMLRATMCEVLEALNYNVIAAVNGREALEILENHHEQIPLVLSDLIMPVMGGAELCREIVRRYDGIQIILMTGYSPEEEILDLKAAGMTHWLQKPVSIDLLAQSIDAAFAVA